MGTDLFDEDAEYDVARWVAKGWWVTLSIIILILLSPLLVLGFIYEKTGIRPKKLNERRGEK